MNNIVAKLGVACTASLVVTESVSLEPLWNALITLGISIISVLAVEGINFLTKFIKYHTKKYEDKEDNKDVKN